MNQSIKFQKNKYSQKLLVDVAWIHDMPSFKTTNEPHKLNFYEITLILEGTGYFWLDEEKYVLNANQIFFTTPGQVRRWYANSLKGICMFFPGSLFSESLGFPFVLKHLHYFHTKLGPKSIVLNDAQHYDLLSKLSDMRFEIANLQGDSHQMLIAKTCEILLQINRWYFKKFGQQQEKVTVAKLNKFRHLLDMHYHEYHRVSQYAVLLAISPGYLNALCKVHLGCTASEHIQRRVFGEAKRQLTYSKMSVETLSTTLGFVDSSYFCRSFKREVGMTPLMFRRTQT